MAKEIERKFLVRDDSYKAQSIRQITIIQAYLSTMAKATVRIRLTDDKAYLTVKGKTHGIERDEWEYEIPVADAIGMLRCCTSTVIKKTRYIVPYAGLKWEVDSFGGHHTGLVVAEVELPSAETEVTLPPFVGEEVTGDPRYYNSHLAQKQ